MNMLKFTAVLAVASVAGSAIASPVLGDYASYTQVSADQVTAISLEEGTQGTSSTLYSNMDAGAGFQAFPADTGPAGFDDYTSTTASQITLEELRFVGGVTSAGGIMSFEFFNAAGDTLVDAFSVAFTDAGNFIYTITLNSEVVIDGAGILQISVDAATTGQWFLSDAAPTIGSEDNMFGGASGGALSHRFELTGSPVPAPGAMALLGMGGLVAGRRRR